MMTATIAIRAMRKTIPLNASMPGLLLAKPVSNLFLVGTQSYGNVLVVQSQAANKLGGVVLSRFEQPARLIHQAVKDRLIGGRLSAHVRFIQATIEALLANVIQAVLVFAVH